VSPGRRRSWGCNLSCRSCGTGCLPALARVWEGASPGRGRNRGCNLSGRSGGAGVFLRRGSSSEHGFLSRAERKCVHRKLPETVIQGLGPGPLGMRGGGFKGPLKFEGSSRGLVGSY
jgi:hypothetical protein